jgi:hypothetical protein
MLKAAEYAYAPANCAPVLRDLARRGKCTILKQRFQNGLLAAVQDRLAQEGRVSMAEDLKSSLMSDPMNSLMQMVLKAADRRMIAQVLIALAGGACNS